jgi:hypothetical protein
MNIITGERIQQLADIYLGYEDDFKYNPLIAKQTQKHVFFSNIRGPFNNPPVMFFYTHRMKEMSEL